VETSAKTRENVDKGETRWFCLMFPALPYTVLPTGDSKNISLMQIRKKLFYWNLVQAGKSDNVDREPGFLIICGSTFCILDLLTDLYDLSVVSPIKLLKHDHCPSVYSYDLIVVFCLVI